jgi:thiamine kinase-like enzyme
MLLETHAHTSRYSKCSVIDPVALVCQVVKRGLQGIVLTEHHYLWNEEDVRQLRIDAEVPHHFHIFAAQEVDTETGHVLVFGADRTVPGKTPLRDLRNLFPDAALVWAHPFRNGKHPSADQLTNPLLDGIEVFSLNQSVEENFYGLTQWHKYKFTALSGSDVHSLQKAGGFPTQFDHPLSSIQEMATEIRHSRCRPFIKEIPKAGSDMQVTEITIGTKGEDELRNRLIIRDIHDKGKWQVARSSANVTAEIYDKGFNAGLFRVPRIIDISDASHLIIEEGQRGKNLFDVLTSVSVETGTNCVILAARWLAALHRLNLTGGSIVDTITHERVRFDSYERSFSDTNSPFLTDARKLIAFAREGEERLFTENKEPFIRVHGDYHPRNIIIGQDKSQDPKTLYISVIDFNNSLLFSPAFDVGYFLAQFRAQFNGFPEILNRYRDSLFLDAYREAAGVSETAFRMLVDLFRIRGYLSIASFLNRVGKGRSAEMQDILAHAASLRNSLVAKLSL